MKFISDIHVASEIQVPQKKRNRNRQAKKNDQAETDDDGDLFGQFYNYEGSGNSIRLTKRGSQTKDQNVLRRMRKFGFYL